MCTRGVRCTREGCQLIGDSCKLGHQQAMPQQCLDLEICTWVSARISESATIAARIVRWGSPIDESAASEIPSRHRGANIAVHMWHCLLVPKLRFAQSEPWACTGTSTHCTSHTRMRCQGLTHKRQIIERARLRKEASRVQE